MQILTLIYISLLGLIINKIVNITLNTALITIKIKDGFKNENAIDYLYINNNLIDDLRNTIFWEERRVWLKIL